VKKQIVNLFESELRRCIRVECANTCEFDIGIEIGALSTFFSLESHRLGTAQVTQEHFEIAENGNWSYQSQIQFLDALINISECGYAHQTCGQRTLRIDALENSRLMDAVLRFVIAKDYVKSAFIGPREIIHQRQNRYHQYPLEQIKLNFKNGMALSFQPISSVLPAGFEYVVYLRDEPDKWILHIRALALTPSHYVLKGCTRWYNRPFPLMIQRIVLGSTWLRSSLLYVRERISQRIPIQVNGAADLPKGSTIQLAVQWTISHAAS
jgi:hypothetical protein